MSGLFGPIESPDCVEHLTECLRAAKCESIRIDAVGTVVLTREGGHEHTFRTEQLTAELLEELDASLLDARLSA